jgi:para-aminobenzoate synthetase component 1
MLREKIAGKNFLYTLCNNHSSGFNNALYILGARKASYVPNSVVFIPYSYKDTILNTNKPSLVYYQVDAFIPTKENEWHVEKDTLPESICFKSLTTKSEYLKRTASLKKHIQRGDIYEINFCLEFIAHDVTINPFEVFQKLNNLSKAPYAALAKLEDVYIMSASPELFLKKQGNTLTTKPIKGTSKRYPNSDADNRSKEELGNSIKEQTENVMIVDVARNDFSRIAEKGSVHVPALFNVETYQTVHQLVSTVTCELKQNTSFAEIIHANFPMPSMTGAPKIRAMELIDSHEQFKRNAYSGTLGYINEAGDFTLSVLIRSLVYNSKTKTLSFAVGSAITNLCDPEEEYSECLLKAQALLKAVNGTIE